MYLSRSVIRKVCPKAKSESRNYIAELTGKSIASKLPVSDRRPDIGSGLAKK